jgi:hypothetical protein
MEFLFADPGIERLSPDKTRILVLQATPDPDGKRLKVFLELTPFQQRPTIEIDLTGPDGEPVASTSIIEPMQWKLELTLHIRGAAPIPGAYTLQARLFYPELGQTDQSRITLNLPAENS